MARCKFGIADVEFANEEDRARFNHFLRATGGDVDLSIELMLDKSSYGMLDRQKWDRGWSPKIGSKEESYRDIDWSIGTQANLEEYLDEYTIADFTEDQENAIVDSLRYIVYKMDLDKISPNEAFGRAKGVVRSQMERNPGIAEDLQKVLDNWDAFRALTVDGLRQLGYRATGEISDEEIVFEGDDADYEKTRYDDSSRFLRDARDSATHKVKLFLSLIPDVEAELSPEGTPVAKLNFLGWNAFLPFDSVWEHLQTVLSDRNPNIKEYLEVLRQQKNPIYRSVAEHLTKAPRDLQSQFISAMTLTHAEMELLLATPVYESNEIVAYELSPIASDRHSQVNAVVGHWIENQKNSPLVTSENGELKLDIHRVKEIRHDYENAVDQAKGEEGGLKGEWFRNRLQELLAQLGITLSDEAMLALPESSKEIFRSSFEASFRLDRDNSFITYVFDAFEQQGSVSGTEEVDAFLMNNPLTGLERQGIIRKLAMHASRFSAQQHPSSYRNVEGMLHHSYQIGHHLSNTFRRFRDESTYREQMTSVSFAEDSMWTRLLRVRPELSAAMKLTYIDGKKQRRSRNGKTRSDMGEAEQHYMLLGYFQGPQRNTIKGLRLAKFVPPTLSDKQVTPLLQFVKQEVGVDIVDAKVTGISSTTLDELINVAVSEIKRISKFQATIKAKLEKDGLFSDYAAGAERFHLLDYLNRDELLLLAEEGVITKEEVGEIWQDGTLILNSNIARTNGLLRRIIEHQTLGEIQKMSDFFYENGIVKQTKDADGKTATLVYMDQNYLENIAPPDGQLDKVAYAVADYVINYRLFMAEYARLFGGDPAHAFKGTTAKTRENVQKRLTAQISPVIPARAGAAVRRVTIGDRVVDSKEAGMYEKRLGISTFRNMESTDAQEFLTTEEFLNERRRYGMIDETMYNSMISKIKKGKKYTFTSEELSALQIQAIKPIGYSRKAYPEYDMVNTVYTKSSAIPLIPQLLEGLGLDRLRVAMEEQGVDRASHQTADKMGISKVHEIYDASGNVKSDIMFEHIQTLPREGLGFQQVTPVGKAPKVLTSTQMNRMLFAGIEDTEGFQFMGETFRGGELRAVKEEIRTALFKEGQKRVLNRLGATLRGGGSVSFPNLTKAREGLIEHARDLGWSKEALKIFEITDGQGFKQPVSFSTISGKIESLLMSMIRSEITKQHLFGRGFNQVSGAGWMGENPKGVTFVAGYNPAEGLRAMHKVDGKLKPGQIIVPWHFKDKKGNPLSIENYVGEDGRINPDMLPDEARRAIGFRIPYQGPSSQMPVEIVGFLPAEVDDMAIVPDEIVEQSGSDFDGDKFYTYLNQYTVDSEGRISKLEAHYQDREVKAPVEDPAVEALLDEILPIPEEAPITEEDDVQKDLDENQTGDGDSSGPGLGEQGADSELPAGQVQQLESEARQKLDDGNLTPDDIGENDVVVVGTRAASEGRGYSGSARLAVELGVADPVGTGRLGDKVFGIKTIEKIGDLKSTPLSEIREGFVELFVEASLNPDKRFLLTKVGSQRAGYTEKEIISALPFDMPANIIAPTGWFAVEDTTAEVTDEVGVQSPSVNELKQAYVDLLWSVMMHEDSMKRIMQPLVLPDLKQELEAIQRAKGTWNESSDPLSIQEQVADNVSQRVGSSLIGVFSNAATINAMIEPYNVRLVDPHYDREKHDAPPPLDIVFHTDGGREIPLNLFSGTTQSTFDGNARTSTLNLAALQNAAVDNVSDNLLGPLNINDVTAGPAIVMSMLSTRGGEGLDLSFITRFSGQESIQMMVEEVARIKSDLGSGFTRDVIEKALYETGSKLRNRIENPIDSETVDNQQLSPKLLLRAMSTDVDRNSEAYVTFQLAVLNRFALLNSVYEEFSTSRAHIVFADKNGAGSDAFTLLHHINGVHNLSKNHRVAGMSELMGTYSSFGLFDQATTEWGQAADHALFFGRSLLRPLLHTLDPRFAAVISQFEDVLGRDASIAEKKDLWSGLRSYIYTKDSMPFGDPVTERERLMMGPNSLAHRIRAAQETSWGTRNFFLSQIKTNLSKKLTEPHTVEYSGLKALRLDESRNLRALVELIKSPDSTQSELARDIVAYAFLTGGAQTSRSFIRHIPIQYLEFIGFNEALRGFSLQENVNIKGFVEQYVQNNPYLATEITLKDTKSKAGYPNRFSWDSKTEAYHYLVRQPDGTSSFPAYLMLRDSKHRPAALYKNKGVEGNGIFWFELIPILGAPGVSEYGSIDNNNLLIANRVQHKGSRSASLLTQKAFNEQNERVLPQVAPHYFQAGMNSKDLFKYAISQMQSEAHQEIGSILEGAIDQLGDSYRLTYTNSLPGPREGMYSSETNTVAVSSRIRSRDRFEEVFLHEHIHALTKKLIVDYTQGNKLPEGVRPIIEEIEKAYRQVREPFLKDAAFGEFLGKVRKAKANPDSVVYFSEKERSEYYPIMNLSEFFTGVMTNPEFQASLNDIEYDGDTSILMRFLDLITNLLSAIGRTLGIEINDRSVLAKSVSDIVSLIELGTNPATETTTDEFQYYGARYTIELQTDSDGNTYPNSVQDYKGKPDRMHKMLEAYRENPDVDPQTGRKFRNEELESDVLVADKDSDSRYVLGPGMVANAQQQVAIDKLVNFLDRDNPAQTFILEGKAGTGKTTILKHAIALAKESSGGYRPVLGTAVSHAARIVLGNAFDGLETHTIAGFLGIRLDEGSGKWSINKWLQKMGVPVHRASIIIVDETSMISKSIMEEILKEKPKKAKVIFVGDHHQLPPIGPTDKDSPTFSSHGGDQNHHAQLWVRERQGEDHPIVALSDVLADNIDSEIIEMMALKDEHRKTDYNEDSDTGVIFTNDEIEMIDMLVEDVKKAGTDPHFVRAIMFNNEKYKKSSQSVYAINKRVREALYGDEGSRNQFYNGDIMVAYDNWSSDPKSPPYIFNSEAFVITDQSEPYIKKHTAVDRNGERKSWTFSTIDLTLKNAEGGKRIVPVIAQVDLAKFNEAVKGEQGFWYYRIIEGWANLNYGYAVTSHKAQGATYRNAYVYEGNILGPTNPGSNKAKNNSLYTAITRPSHKLVMHHRLNKNGQEASAVTEESIPATSKDSDLNGNVSDFMKTLTPAQRELFRSLRLNGDINTKCD